VNTYDPADSIVYVHLAVDGARTRPRLAADEAGVLTLTTGGPTANDHDRRSPACGRSSDQIS
jgi:hypothetical protein